MAKAQQQISLETQLRAALAHDADVICIPALETAAAMQLAAAAANRGVLVVAGVRAESASDALALVGEAVSPRTLAAVFRIAVAVRAVSRLCPKSARARLPREEVDELEARGARLGTILATLKDEQKIGPDAQWKDVPFFAPVRCEACESGFSGTTLLCEVVPTNMALVDLLRRGAARDEIEELAREDGALSLLEDGVYKAAIGETTVEEVLMAGV